MITPEEKELLRKTYNTYMRAIGIKHREMETLKIKLRGELVNLGFGSKTKNGYLFNLLIAKEKIAGKMLCEIEDIHLRNVIACFILTLDEDDDHILTIGKIMDEAKKIASNKNNFDVYDVE